LAKILLVEDDADLAETTQQWLVSEKNVVEVVYTGTDARERLRFYKYELIILDWELPGKSGLELLRDFRESGGKTPILFLTGRADIVDKETGLDSGADDYLTKPFSPRELAARIRALLRRSSESSDTVLQARDIRLDAKNCTVLKNGEPVHLTPRELALLEFFMRHAGTVFSAEALLDRVWHSESDASPDTVRAYITKLRSKIDKEGCESIIRTVYKLGYALEKD
jgi:DNA-binding response OmpR family regulator